MKVPLLDHANGALRAINPGKNVVSSRPVLPAFLNRRALKGLLWPALVFFAISSPVSAAIFNGATRFSIGSSSTDVRLRSSSDGIPLLDFAGSVGDYSVAGRVCMEGWCSGTGTVGNVDTPLQLRFTNVTATCAASPACGSIFFSGSWTTEALIAPGYAGFIHPFSMMLTGNSTAPFTGSLRVEAESGSTIFSVTVPLSFGAGSFTTGPIAIGSVLVPINDVVSLSFGLTIDGLPAGATLNLPSSLELTVGSADTAVPEPSAWLTAGSALIGIGAIHRRRKRALRAGGR